MIISSVLGLLLVFFRIIHRSSSIRGLLEYLALTFVETTALGAMSPLFVAGTFPGITVPFAGTFIYHQQTIWGDSFCCYGWYKISSNFLPALVLGVQLSSKPGLGSAVLQPQLHHQLRTVHYRILEQYQSGLKRLCF